MATPHVALIPSVVALKPWTLMSRTAPLVGAGGFLSK